MRGVLVDSNVALDLFLNDPQWGNWSESTLEHYALSGNIFINPVIYSEISIGFSRIEGLESAILKAGFKMLSIPREALFLAGKVFLKYKRRDGSKRSPMPDFFIGAQAAVLGIDLVTRDTKRYRSCFPTVRLISPNK